MITFGSAQILGSLNWRELSAKLTEGVPARRRQRSQYIIAVRISRHHPSAVADTLLGEEGIPMSEIRRIQRLPPRGSCHEVTEGVSRPQRNEVSLKFAVRTSQATESAIYNCCVMFKTPPVSFAATLLGEEGITMSEICTKPKAPSPRVKKPSVSLKNSSNSLSCHHR